MSLTVHPRSLDRIQYILDHLEQEGSLAIIHLTSKQSQELEQELRSLRFLCHRIHANSITVSKEIRTNVRKVNSLMIWDSIYHNMNFLPIQVASFSIDRTIIRLHEEDASHRNITVF